MNQVMGKITASHVCGCLHTLWKSFNHITSLLGESIQSSSHNNRYGIPEPPIKAGCLLADINAYRSHSEILCKRMSWMVAQTIVRQLVSVVNTSI